MRVTVDFMPSSFRQIHCLVKNEEQVVISRSSASVDDSANDAKEIMCAAFGAAPVVPQGSCKLIVA